MKTAIGGTWILQIVIVMIVFFTGYLSLSVNYTKAFNVKNEVVKIIERHNGVNEETLSAINSYLNSVGYRTKGDCGEVTADETEWHGFDSRTTLEGANMVNNNADYCVRRLYVAGRDNVELPSSSYYQVKVFFKLDIPILSYIFNFDVKGDTKYIYYPTEDGWYR